MSIIDIRFRNDEAYLLKNHMVTLKGFSEQIAQISYNAVYEKYKLCKEENGAERAQFPPINYVFYYSIFNNGQVLSPECLIQEYFSMYHDMFISDEDSGSVRYNGQLYFTDAIKGRILRTYPSLVRDFHFFLMLVEERCFEQVIYSCKNDIQGKDIIIKHNKKEYEISLFVDTNRSNFFKIIKNCFRHKYKDSEIQVPLNLKVAKTCGDFFVYDESHISIVKNRILKE